MPPESEYSISINNMSDNGIIWTTDGTHQIGDIIDTSITTPAPPGGQTIITGGEGSWVYSDSITEETKPIRFRNLDNDEKNRLAHVMKSDVVYVRVKKPDLESNEKQNYELAVEISDTEDFLVHVNLVEGEAKTMAEMIDVQSIANTVCLMMTFSGTEVILDGDVFEPRSVGG